jgi:hypothetical protein
MTAGELQSGVFPGHLESSHGSPVCDAAFTGVSHVLMCSSVPCCSAPSWPEGSGGHGEALKHAEEAEELSLWSFTHTPSL